MNRAFCTFLTVLFLTGVSIGQTGEQAQTRNPRSVSLCDLALNPKSFNKQWVSVRAGLSMSFEDFSLHDPGCNVSNPSIWVTFGGDQSEITTFCCVGRNRKRGSDLEVEGER